MERRNAMDNKSSKNLIPASRDIIVKRIEENKRGDAVVVVMVASWLEVLSFRNPETPWNMCNCAT